MPTTIPSELSCLSSPPEGVWVWVRTRVRVCGLPSLQSTFCPARVDLCLAAEQICQDGLVCILGGVRLHTWPQPSQISADCRHDVGDRASTYLSRGDLSTVCISFNFTLWSLQILSALLSGFSPHGFVSYSTCSDSCTVQRYVHWAVVTYEREDLNQGGCAAACSSHGKWTRGSQVFLIHYDFI